MYQLLEDEVTLVSGGTTEFMRAHPEHGYDIALGIGLAAVIAVAVLPIVGFGSCMGAWHFSNNICAGVVSGLLVTVATTVPVSLGFYLLLDYLQ